MTKRKRKSPEKKKPARHALSLLLAGGTALARLAGRYPRSVAGVTLFSLVFGTVAANALWYQPGQHPSPFLRTRDAADFTALAGMPKSPLLKAHDPANVTTFKIEREGEASTEETAEAAPADGATRMAADPQATPAALPAAASETADIIRKVQAELLRRGLYQGEPDGVVGPRTETAIAVFQKTVGMEANGLVSPELLAALALDRNVTAAVPAQRPAPEIASPAEDPVAAAIRSAETRVVTAPRRPVTAPGTMAEPARLPATALVPPQDVKPAADQPPPIQQASFDPGLVMEIQRGLSNMAYKDVTIDGVPGEQTRAAIRRFERHYQLPETGEPSAAVLKKLKSIGAL
ncbi:peptidoglycan-binding protein [Rhizobium sp. Root274]|uniref:peptidoglycan-binding domain-containing protein n=1 Tax=unclassified Rhizobium TaxID=2613769 RepID=UPI0007146AD0|nr:MULTISPECIES: peptidoglycan-binding protein [unclassified Rhizobium]KQW31193.1 peptidoglycan-binding protein [Rhizobium sp. Root1240]KRD32739.1 peptidoglycan-binding protein [Rhizobium sp. Root274]